MADGGAGGGAGGAGGGGGGGGGAGGGGGWDPCECIWNHANSMTRLLNYVCIKIKAFHTHTRLLTDVIVVLYIFVFHLNLIFNIYKTDLTIEQISQNNKS